MHFHTTIVGSTGEKHRVDYSHRHGWHCDCKGFLYRKQCKHIEAVKKTKCNWDQFTDGGEPIDKMCPMCGTPTEVIGVGV